MKKMKRFLLLGTMVALLLVGVYGAWAIHEIIPSETIAPLPGIDAEKLNEYIVRFNPYRAWEMWPGKERLYKGAEPHGAMVTTFVNPAAYFSAKDKKGIAYDSIIVQENYSADKKFVALTVMYRVKGYNPEGGDWFWAKYAADGKVMASGKVKECIDCHGKKRDNDYIMTSPVK